MTEPKAKTKRIELQKAVAAEIEAAILKAEGLFGIDPSAKTKENIDDQRRLFRAIVTVAAKRLFDLGVPPQVVAHQAAEAAITEFKYRQTSALAQGQPFGPTPPGKA